MLSTEALRKLLPWLLAAAAGALWALPFGIEPQVVVPWLALVPLFLLLDLGRTRMAFGLGWVHGTLFWLVSIPWIAPTLETFGSLPGWLAKLLLLALALYLGLYTALFAALGAPIWRRLPWPGALAALPALWVALEWVRGWMLTGFPWNLAGYAWTEVAGALPLGAWIGVWGVSYLVVWANCGLALALRHGPGRRALRWRPAAVGVLGPLLLLALAGRFAAPAELSDPHWLVAGSEPVRIVQPAIYNQTVYDPEVTREGYTRLIRLSREACDLPGALVVWPESAAWPFELERDPLLARDVARLTSGPGSCALLLNSTFRADDQTAAAAEGVYYNSAYLIGAGSAAPEERTVRYDKRHLVPFGEYVPLAGVFSFLDQLARNAGSYTAADGVTLLPWRGERLGAAICFEITFPSEVADLVRAGASVLVTMTNDAWYGDSAAPRQHFRAARWRAAETGRPLLRAAITGISAVVAPDGSVRRLLGVGETGIVRARITGRQEITLFVRAPWAVPALSVALAAFAIIFASRRSTP